MTTAVVEATTTDPPRPTTDRRRRPRRRSSGLGRGESRAAWLMLSPNLLLFGVFLLMPLLATFVLSLYESSGFGPREFTGLANYRELAGDGTFWRATLNTAVFAVATVPLSLAIGLGLALMLDRPLPGRSVLRAIYYLPYVLSGVVVAVAGRWLFDENVGVINRILRAIGTEGLAWQSQAGPAMTSLVLISVWTKIGFAMVVYLAALQAIPREYVEAAEVDGATKWQRLRHVVVPLLRPTTAFLIVLGVIESFQIFDVVYVLTGGGPGNATEMLVTYAYAEGFDARRQGYAAAIGVITYLFVLVLTALWWRRQRERESVQ